ARLGRPSSRPRPRLQRLTLPRPTFHSAKSRRFRVVSFGRIMTGSVRLILNSGLVSTTVCLPAGSLMLIGVGPLSTPSTLTLHHGLAATSSVPSPSSFCGAAGSLRASICTGASGAGFGPSLAAALGDDGALAADAADRLAGCGLRTLFDADAALFFAGSGRV